MKKCDICKDFKDLDSFCKNSRNKSGLHTTCKVCKKRLDQEYQQKNFQKIKEKKHAYYLKNKKRIVAKTTAFILKNPDKRSQYGAAARLNYKIQAFQAYSDGVIKCVNCEKSDLELLTLDHISGGGNKHRQANKIGAGGDTYRFLKKNAYPPGFQVLCWNCQFKKKHQEIKPKNPTKQQLRRMNYSLDVKKICMENYGKFCPCGEQDIMVLTLDHVNDDGAKHRKELGKSGTGFYLHLRKNNFPQNPPLQVLCMNCQYIKRLNLGKR